MVTSSVRVVNDSFQLLNDHSFSIFSQMRAVRSSSFRACIASLSVLVLFIVTPHVPDKSVHKGYDCLIPESPALIHADDADPVPCHHTHPGFLGTAPDDFCCLCLGEGGQICHDQIGPGDLRRLDIQNKTAFRSFRIPVSPSIFPAPGQLQLDPGQFRIFFIDKGKAAGKHSEKLVICRQDVRSAVSRSKKAGSVFSRKFTDDPSECRMDICGNRNLASAAVRQDLSGVGFGDPCRVDHEAFARWQFLRTARSEKRFLHACHTGPISISLSPQPFHGTVTGSDGDTVIRQAAVIEQFSLLTAKG